VALHNEFTYRGGEEVKTKKIKNEGKKERRGINIPM
jgi:hypothetical protein